MLLKNEEDDLSVDLSDLEDDAIHSRMKQDPWIFNQEREFEKKAKKSVLYGRDSSYIDSMLKQPIQTKQQDYCGDHKQHSKEIEM